VAQLFSPGLEVGNVQIVPRLQSMAEVEADALVHTFGNDYRIGADWVHYADSDGSVSNALERYGMAQLGDVLITPAGALHARYLFAAVVINWADAPDATTLLDDQIVTQTAWRCIRIAAVLGLRSITFTPWGTRATDITASRVVERMLDGIVPALREDPGKLELVLLVSNKAEHYQQLAEQLLLAQERLQAEDVTAEPVSSAFAPGNALQTSIVQLQARRERALATHDTAMAQDLEAIIATLEAAQKARERYVAKLQNAAEDLAPYADDPELAAVATQLRGRDMGI